MVGVVIHEPTFVEFFFWLIFFCVIAIVQADGSLAYNNVSGVNLQSISLFPFVNHSNQSMENKNSLPEGSKSMEMEQQARVSLFTVTQAVVRQAIDVLTRALCFEGLLFARFCLFRDAKFYLLMIKLW